MLPSLGSLSLRPSPARTGEFVTLSREEADERNARREVEPVTHEEYVPSRELPDGDDYFRVRFEYQKPDHTYDYTVYDAETLWRWVQNRYTLPHNREPIWREDWMELHERYDPQGNVPQEVAWLPSVNKWVIAYEGEGDQRRRVRAEHPNGEWIFFDGPRGEEHKVRAEWPNGVVHFYDGPKGEEYKVRAEWPDGEVRFYDGIKGEEHAVRSEYPNGTVVFYDGPKGEDRVVRIRYPNGNVQFYKGPKGEERVVRVQDPKGAVYYYEGPKGEERLWARRNGVAVTGSF